MTSSNSNSLLTAHARFDINYEFHTDTLAEILRTRFEPEEFSRFVLSISEAELMKSVKFIKEPGNSRLLHNIIGLAKQICALSGSTRAQAREESVNELFLIATSIYVILRLDSYFTNKIDSRIDTNILIHLLLESLLVLTIDDISSSMNDYVAALHYMIYNNSYPANEIYSHENLTSITELNSKFQSFGLNEALIKDIPLTLFRAEAMTSLKVVSDELDSLKNMLVSNVTSRNGLSRRTVYDDNYERRESRDEPRNTVFDAAFNLISDTEAE